MAPAPRAASCSFLRPGSISVQRGRRAQLSFITSRMRSAVVLPSSVTAFTSGAAGALTFAHSFITSAAFAGGTPSATPTMANERKRFPVLFIMSSRWSFKLLLLIAAGDLGLPWRYPTLDGADEEIQRHRHQHDDDDRHERGRGI